MRVAIHQPEHLPWLGYFAKMDAADLLVHLDDVQFEKNYFQNRNRVADVSGRPFWLTVSLALPQGHLTRIRDALLLEPRTWLKSYFGRLDHALGATRFVDEVMEWLVPKLETESKLAELNLNLIQDVATSLGICTPSRRSSELRTSQSKSDRLLEILRDCSATEYLIGRGSLGYLDFPKFRRASIDVVLVEYAVTENVSSDGRPLSVLQYLCNSGLEGSPPSYQLSKVDL